MATDAGPWQGMSQEEWISRISPWPVPWVVREVPTPLNTAETLYQLEELGIRFGITESELRVLDGNR